jgi:adenine deaminase
MNSFTIQGNIVDISSRVISLGEITIQHGIIASISIPKQGVINPLLAYISPGFIDAHVHIESSMLIPAEFARLAVVHGTVATVSDPHEIANVCGMEGVRFMIENGKQVPFKFNFGAPSCVPATFFETAGAVLNAVDVKELLHDKDIRYLTEMMNFPGAISGDHEVLEKINAAHELGKPVDGHAPGLTGEDLRKYIARGISTDHECFTIEEAQEKLALGMKIIIREGSAAKNFDELIPLIEQHAEKIMFCSDDKHPDSLVLGHINLLCSRAVEKGYNIFNILQAACINPILHYGLEVGMLRVGDPADFILLEDLNQFKVLATYIDGVQVSENTKSFIKRCPLNSTPLNHFHCEEINRDDLLIESLEEYTLPVIGCIDGQLITLKKKLLPTLLSGYWNSNVANDVLKIVVVNRYHPAPVSKAFVNGFGLKRGAIASSVAHDSHNIVAVGADDESIMRAINSIIRQKGGICCVSEDFEQTLSLPVAGLMSADDGYAVSQSYTELDRQAKDLGSTLAAPFMSLSFMALLVIPHVKLSDKGLFDGDQFCLYS